MSMSLLAVLMTLAPVWQVTSIERVKDGDTFDAVILVWPAPRESIYTTIRIRGIDTPELKGKCERERQMARQATARLRELLAAGPVYLREIGFDAYGGRVDASVMNEAGQDIGEAMVASGLAVPMGVKRTKDWCR